ncbi:MAG TPA: WGR domain-containing protein [Kofleriaceae bacterium]|jgi:bifunctional non-homologous end joining protein LigD|nr:WGR domain-containing protein [Kofleriaceae bacterium]
MATIKRIELFFQEGSSDKVYNAEIDDVGGAFTVHVEWGRRGSRLNTGDKAVRVTRAAAEATFAKLVREKASKGYEERAGEHQPAAVAPPEGAGSGSRVTGKRARVGARAQLLSAIDDDAELAKLLADSASVAQQKLDGVRVLVTVGDDGLVATNRDGQVTQLAGRALDGLAYLPKATIVDGEVLGDAYWLFDVLELAGEDVRARGYLERWELLDNELEPALTGGARILPVAQGAKAKQALHDKLRVARAEGIVFKHREAPYTAGRGTTQRKYKFVKSADVVIVENAGNAYRMAVYDGGKLFDVGSVFSGTTNASRAELNTRLGRGDKPVAEVKYLYATDDHQLFQPVFVALRSDKIANACTRAQLVETDRGVIA